MIELRTLGALELISADSRPVGSVLAQPRRAALLCYLALALPRGFHRRDTLVALFWPELDQQHARNALRQSVFFLRRALGANSIVSRGDEELALAPEQVRCDVWAFDAAIDQERPTEALALYRGELLTGFHISDAPDFERWLDEERSRLRQRAGEAGWALAAARERDGDVAGAAEAARRAAAFAPNDETALRRLILLLERVGDRAAAVRAYEAFAWELEREYELEPSTETQAVVARIRAEPGESQPTTLAHRNGSSAAAGNGTPRPGRQQAESSTGPVERLPWK
jgi:DNA-binding SARP family transcriptional activator